MGRGLSDLQKTILRVGADEAVAKKFREECNAHADELGPAHPFYAIAARPNNAYRVHSSTIYDICYPAPAAITAANRVAMSKAFKRLVDRGLMKEREGRTCWFLTPEGVLKGQELLGN